jgi:hypothetical protein
MSETTIAVPGGETTADAQTPDAGSPAAAQGEGQAGAAQSSASDETGLAPGPVADAASALGAQGEPSAPPAGEFVFAGRRWPSAKHAEDYFRSQGGRVPDLQRKTAEQERQIAELSSTVQALQRALSVTPPAEPGQGNGRGTQTPAGQQPFIERFRNDDLPFLLDCLRPSAEGEDPSAGVARFTYGLAEVVGREMESLREQIRQEDVAPIVRQHQFREHESRVLNVARGLGGDFPEFDNANQAPEAVQAQQEFVSVLKQFPPDFVVANPDLAMLASALVTRHRHGIPVTATQPGTSGSPSALAALAAEGRQATGEPLDGSASRPRPSPPQPRSAEDQFEADIISADDKLARNLDGKPLGWTKVRRAG